jgi:hypothetical protein
MPTPTAWPCTRATGIFEIESLTIAREQLAAEPITERSDRTTFSDIADTEA